MPVSAVCTIPAGALQIGSLIKVKLRGRISTLVTSPGTLTLDLRIGGVVVSAFGAITLNATAQTNATFDAEFIGVVRTVGNGTSATIIATTGTTVTISAASTAGVGSGVTITFGGDMNLTNTNIASGQTVNFTSQTFTASGA